MKCTVLSRNKAIDLSYDKISEPVVIISIIDIDNSPVQFAENEKIKDLLRLSFNDVDKNSFGAMTQTDADKIIEFCLKWLPQTNLIVQCEAGVSRSAGVCAAILKWYNGCDTEIFENAFYRPNMHCYRQVINAFERSVENNEKQD